MTTKENVTTKFGFIVPCHTLDEIKCSISSFIPTECRSLRVFLLHSFIILQYFHCYLACHLQMAQSKLPFARWRHDVRYCSAPTPLK